MEDARVYSEHAQKKELDVSDVKLAVQTRMDHSFTTPPPRDVSDAATPLRGLIQGAPDTQKCRGFLIQLTQDVHM